MIKRIYIFFSKNVAKYEIMMHILLFNSQLFILTHIIHSYYRVTRMKLIGKVCAYES